ncbi:MAG: SIMPL domain-containing protein [Solirubrobacterales bacterium]|nr:SIMPL domain-containing protein [Solirubrobacterales bacterium]MBV9366956.1 SIMPL domain-containing protein [Solirubrobacterales bacterium]MBV9806394.1 SIMPL domain-containing protein [Solirubrobacterales bacterium]
MQVRLVLGVAMVAALLVTTPAGAVPAPTSSGDTVTATGIGQAPVVPKNRLSNASIVAAVDRAHKAAIAAALKEAHEYALEYSKAVGLTLGSVISVSDAQSGPFFYGPGPAIPGPFGLDKYCHTVKKVHRCVVPPSDFATLTVTYSAG